MTDYSDVWYQSRDGLKLYARDYAGPANAAVPPVLCMHGLTRNSADFEVIAEHLAGQRRVIVVDQRGRGRSEYDSNSANYNPLTYVEDMFTLLDHLAIDQVILLGTSLGGLMSMLMGSMQPQRFPAIIINDIGPELQAEGIARIKAFVGRGKPITSWDEAVAATREINGLAFPHYSDADWLAFARRLYVEQDGVPVLAHDPRIAEPMNTPGDDPAAMDLWPVFDSLHGIPMLVIRGSITDLLSPECARRMAEEHPDLTLAEVPGVGHAPMLDEPAAMAAIDDFLARVDGAGAVSRTASA
jgi:pimeloyl-ACP methyl ester carboxylesterase